MTVSELCQKIELQEELLKKVLDVAKSLDVPSLEQYIQNLTNPALSAEAYKALAEKLGDDPYGAKILFCYLKAALITYEEYRRLGIDEQIYIDTMKCFTRFSAEWLERKDILGFFSAHWSYRHLNTTLIRIGTLEFERVTRGGKLAISVHIPSNADLSADSLDHSFKTARQLINEKFPEYIDAPIFCESWLISRDLQKVLPKNSKILQFQERFELQRQNPVTQNALMYIFHRVDCSNYEALPENTSLQRNVKELLRNGGGIGSAYGVLREN